MLLPAGVFLPLSAFLSVPFPRCNRNRQLSAATLEAFGLIFPHIPPRRKPPLPAACFHMLLQFQSDSVGLVTSADIGRSRAAPVTCDASSRIRCHYVFCFFITQCFWPKSQSFSVAKIVCSRERLMSLDQCPAAQIFLYQACGFGGPKIKSICWQSLVHPFSAPTFSAPKN